jgi:hypothetical protein
MWISGGALNLNKCYYFAFAPVINCKKRKTQCTDLPTPHPLVITNRADNSKHHIERVSPSVSRRTLGVLLSPDGDGRNQLRLCLSRAKEFLGKFKNSSMPNKAKWIAVTTVIEPAIIYPLLNTTFSPKDISPIDSCLSQMKCSALGLNRNFPRAVLHGPTGLGGLGIPSICQKNIKDLITYFLYNLCRPSPIRERN